MRAAPPTFASAFPSLDGPLPAILVQQEKALPREIVNAAELDAAAEPPELIALFSRRLAAA